MKKRPCRVKIVMVPDGLNANWHEFDCENIPSDNGTFIQVESEGSRHYFSKAQVRQMTIKEPA